VGKTRFLLEFLNLLRRYLQQKQFDKDVEVLALRDWLCSGRMVLLDLRHNGNALSEKETAWPADIILGLRVATKYWFPPVPYSDVRDAVIAIAKTTPDLLDVFSLRSVLKAVARHPPTTTATNSPSEGAFHCGG
jgi:hypothetical protein